MQMTPNNQQTVCVLTELEAGVPTGQISTVSNGQRLSAVFVAICRTQALRWWEAACII